MTLVLGKTADQKTKAFLHYYTEAFALYQQHKWTAAKEAFNKALALRKDKTTSLHIERCTQYEQTPPPGDWSGAVEVKVK